MMPAQVKAKGKTSEIDWEKERLKSRAILKYLAIKQNWKALKVKEMTPEEREEWAINRKPGRVDWNTE